MEDVHLCFAVPVFPAGGQEPSSRDPAEGTQAWPWTASSWPQSLGLNPLQPVLVAALPQPLSGETDACGAVAGAPGVGSRGLQLEREGWRGAMGEHWRDPGPAPPLRAGSLGSGCQQAPAQKGLQGVPAPRAAPGRGLEAAGTV